ncbi:uncharacterized protein LOC133744376 [Rosa rugosa]|uniref:uncharacterized protein LOC133744376 n=1 Tax=Rosa rugosa TaxID=74645 RepID=UPI002B4006AB|nr:uncharacterized protein LOC133744376 [Rosa rugosa]
MILKCVVSLRFCPQCWCCTFPRLLSPQRLSLPSLRFVFFRFGLGFATEIVCSIFSAILTRRLTVFDFLVAAVELWWEKEGRGRGDLCSILIYYWIRHQPGEFCKLACQVSEMGAISQLEGLLHFQQLQHPVCPFSFGIQVSQFSGFKAQALQLLAAKVKEEYEDELWSANSFRSAEVLRRVVASVRFYTSIRQLLK